MDLIATNQIPIWLTDLKLIRIRRMNIKRIRKRLTDFVTDLEFVHANSKCYLKTSIIVIIGEQGSRYPLL